MSGDYLLFNRDSYRAKWTTGRIVLHQISTGHEEILARFSGAYRDGDVYSGQVSGDFATWTRCARGVGACDVYIHRISTDHTMRVPNRAREYAASISADGTAFYMRDDKYCGRHAKLIELLNGHEHVVKSFARNRDAIDTYAVSESVLVHDLLNCKTHVSDVYETRIS
ncbi:MAG: hypothetical protein ACJ76P_00595 [Actinomycetota bacterium]